MSNVKLIFLPGNAVGNNSGDYEMFIDFDSSVTPSSMEFEAPTGWSTKGIKLYPATINPAGKIIPDPTKKADMGQLNNANLAEYQALFNANTATLPMGFFFSAPTNTLISTGQTDGLFEFLVWIQDNNNSNNNDYLDPGIKNHT